MRTTVKQAISPVDKNYLFNLLAVESINFDGDPWSKPVRQPYYQIVWITRGCGYVAIDLEKYRIEDNTIYTIPPGRVHQLMPEGGLTGYLLSFSIDFLYLAIERPGRPFFEDLTADLNRVKIYLLKGESQALQTVLGNFSREFEAHLMLHLEILSSYFKVFLMYMKRQAAGIWQEEEVACHRSQLVNNFYAKLDKQFRTMRQVADYANELLVSPGYLTTVIKKMTGYSVSYHIKQRTVQEAKRLVIYDDASMKVVAYSLGFDDISHFSKYFKNAAGMKFSEFRKQTI